MAGIQKHRHGMLDWPPTNGPLRKKFGIFISLILILVFMCYTLLSVNQFGQIVSTKRRRPNSGKYLIRTSKCRIPEEDPFNEDVISLFHPEPYTKCSQKPLLSYVSNEKGVATLSIKQELLSLYSSHKIECCHSSITRFLNGNKSDDKVNTGNCIRFEGSVEISTDFVLVKCQDEYEHELYSNVHAVIDPNRIPGTKQISAKPKTSFNVLLVGIDSISKMNLIRALPRTHNFLEESGYINLRGYTKIGDNTFPNLVAILTGRTWKQLYDHCHPGKSYMDNCDLIWDRFRNLGYLTAYAEDETVIGTFNYVRHGFHNPPTNYYFRPYFLAAEQLKGLKKSGMNYCTGPETSGERIMNLAKDFTVSLKNYSKFGLFWMNTFSHDDLNLPSSMDAKIESFLRDIQNHLEDTIFVFFSDHGFRFGDIRYTHTGWLEERLPFIYVHLPNSFKDLYPQEYSNFLINSERLTSPYDIYMMLQDVLYFANDSYAVQTSQACPDCRSLFKEVDEGRTCSDAAIDQHWCMCTGHSYIDTDKPIVRETAEFIVSEINYLVRNYSEGEECASYDVRRVVSAGMSESYLNDRNQSVHYFLLMIETRPPAMFEATVEASLQPTKYVFRLLGDISRTNRYADNSFCVEDTTLKKYCYCDGLFNSIKSAICTFWNCF